MAVKLHRRGVELDALLRTAPNHRKQGRNLPRWLDGNRYRYRYGYPGDRICVAVVAAAAGRRDDANQVKAAIAARPQPLTCRRSIQHMDDGRMSNRAVDAPPKRYDDSS